MNSLNVLPAPCDTLVTKYHHHTAKVSDPPTDDRTIIAGEKSLCTASAPPMAAPATIGMMSELTV